MSHWKIANGLQRVSIFIGRTAQGDRFRFCQSMGEQTQRDVFCVSTVMKDESLWAQFDDWLRELAGARKRGIRCLLRKEMRLYVCVA